MPKLNFAKIHYAGGWGLPGAYPITARQKEAFFEGRINMDEDIAQHVPCACMWTRSGGRRVVVCITVFQDGASPLGVG